MGGHGEGAWAVRRYLGAAAVVVLVALAAVALLVLDRPLQAAGGLALALAVAAVARPTLGRVPTRRPTVSTAELKEYRRRHPGATISDAIEGTRD